MKAQKLLGQLALGQDPFTGAGANDTQVITLKAAFADFKAARKTLKVRTVYDYERALQRAFTDWLSLPLAGITKDMVAARHGRLGQNSGPAYANYAMRLLQAIYNFAMYQYEDPQGRPTIHINPAVRLTQTRGWYRIPRRQTVIRAHQLPAWLSAVDGSRSTKSSRSTRSILTRALRTSVSSEGT